MKGEENSREYQKKIASFLERKFGKILKEKFREEDLIRVERGLKLGGGFYSPRMDVAVGPFSFARGNRNEEYNQLLDIHEIREFLSRVVKRGKTLTKDFIKSVKDSENKNPRCFICIEVENKSTRKHFMGSAFNSSIMGKVGIVISYDKGKMEKVFSYLKE
ncbi:hypothetical protein DRP07_10575, partial [Archaeoglobales archaeon]